MFVKHEAPRNDLDPLSSIRLIDHVKYKFEHHICIWIIIKVYQYSTVSIGSTYKCCALFIPAAEAY